VLPNEQRAGIGYTFIKVLALWLIEQCGLGFFEAVEGFGRRWVFGLVRMDQKGFLAVLDLDVGVRDSWLEVKDGITEKNRGLAFVEQVVGRFEAYESSLKAFRMRSISASYVAVSA
jgi:hypothetical protein